MEQNEWYILECLLTNNKQEPKVIIGWSLPSPAKFFPNEKIIHHTAHHILLCLGRYDFSEKKRMSRRPAEDRGAVVSLHNNEGLTTAETCRKDWIRAAICDSLDIEIQ